jgi:hypothetical protein
MYTIQRKTRPTRHTLFTLSSSMTLDHTYLTWSMYSNFSWSRQQRWTELLLLRKRAPNTIHNTTADRSTGPYQFLSWDSHWSSGGKATICWRHATRLTGPISPTCDRYVQYLLVGANPLVLNRHRQELQSWRCQLFTYHSPIFPTSGLHFPPKGPARYLV